MWATRLYARHDWIPHETTVRYTLALTDEGGTGLTLTQVTTVDLSIYDLETTPPTPLVIGRDIKNINGGQVAQNGLLTLTLGAADTALAHPSRAYEQRRWLIEWTYATGNKVQKAQVDRILVRTLETNP